MIRVVHASDIHIDDAVGPSGYGGLDGLGSVLEAARSLNADVLLIAGDTFDNLRISDELARASARLLEASGLRVVLLPGNHDPVVRDGVYRRAGLWDCADVHVLGVNRAEQLLIERLDLEVAGRAHRGFDDMDPVTNAKPSHARWRIVMAHGHYVPAAEWDANAHRAWRISDRALAETPAHYIALGHWDRYAKAGAAGVPAHYSGAPDLARTVNVVTFPDSGDVRFQQFALPPG